MLFGKRIAEATLVSQSENGRSIVKPLSLPISIVGSRQTSEVTYNGQHVMPSHAAIVYDGQEFWIRDLVSATGTFVDGESVSEVEINDGCEIRVGDYTVVFRLGDPHLTRPVWPQRLTQCAISVPGLSEQHYLSRVVTVIGAREGCDLVLNHKSVAEVHAILVRTCRGLWLHDMASKTGSQVNRRRMDQKLLVSGDEIEIGPFSFTISVLRAGSAADRGLSASLMVDKDLMVAPRNEPDLDSSTLQGGNALDDAGMGSVVIPLSDEDSSQTSGPKPLKM